LALNDDNHEYLDAEPDESFDQDNDGSDQLSNIGKLPEKEDMSPIRG
jgi:hypothetical protein